MWSRAGGEKGGSPSLGACSRVTAGLSLKLESCKLARGKSIFQTGNYLFLYGRRLVGRLLKRNYGFSFANIASSYVRECK